MLNVNAPKNFTATCDQEAEDLLKKVLLEIKETLKDTNLCVLLGGSYGRGDGGVRLDRENGLLYNDLDFFVFATKSSPSDQVLLKEIAKKYEEILHVDVDFSRIMTVKDIQKNAMRLMMQELKRGYFLVCGEDLLAKHLVEIPSCNIPFQEACRLLLNRGMGLILAGDKIANNSPDLDFILRNIYKAILGTGDAILIANNLYDWKIANRITKIEQLDILDDWKKLYQEAVQFKHSPSRIKKDNLLDFYLKVKEFFNFGLLYCAKANDKTNLVDALKKQCIKNKEVSIANYIKYCIKSRSLVVKDFYLYFLPPVTSILPTLYNSLEDMPCSIEKSSKLYKLWLIFN
jgi:hypothetical protein